MIPRYSRDKMSSIWSEDSKFNKFLRIEILSAEAYSKSGLIPKDALARIRKKAKFSINRINEIEKKTNHDVVAFIEDVGESIGKDAKYLHIGLTSSDLLDTTLALQAREASDIIIEDLEALIKVLSKKAKLYKDMVCMGRSHGIHAEPMTFGFKLALMYEESRRNLERMKIAKEEISRGKISGAVGTYSNIEPFVEKYVCKKLGLKSAPISTQIIPRDIHAQFISTLALIGASLERFATEIRHLQRTEVLEAEEPFSKGQKGSSAMPHKRNPIICERICGLARILKANAQAALENVNLWHERDISHSSVERIIFPDSTIALDYILNKFIGVIEGLIVYPQNMLANVVKTKGLIFSQRLLLALMDKGLTRMKAYELVQKQAMRSWQEGLDFKKLVLEDKDIVKYLKNKEIEACFNIDYYLRNVNYIFRRLGL